MSNRIVVDNFGDAGVAWRDVQFVAGGETSESERDISVGGVGQVPAELFAGFEPRVTHRVDSLELVSDLIQRTDGPTKKALEDAVRDKKGKFKDIQTYKRAHAADLRHGRVQDRHEQRAGGHRRGAHPPGA